MINNFKKCKHFFALINSTRTGSSNSLLRSSKIMSKFLKDSKKKKSWHPSTNTTSISFQNMQNFKSGMQGKSRVTMLNKLFMKYITDIMSCGNNADLLLGYGIEISNVRTSPDFTFLNVYWIAKGSENDSKIAEVLSGVAGPLRSELSSLKLMGNVPRIKFVKDSTYARVAEVEKILNSIDFGEDYEMTKSENFLKEEFTMGSSLPDNLKSKIAELEDDSPLPEMRHDVFGLDHRLIMNRIIATKHKSKGLLRLQQDDEMRMEDEQKLDRVEKSKRIQFNKETYSKFLLNQKKMYKNQTKSFEEDLERSQNISFNSEDDIDEDTCDESQYLDEDYLDESEDSKI